MGTVKLRNRNIGIVSMTYLSARLRASLVCGLACFALLGGCASTGNPRDPLEPLNRGIYHFNDGVDTVLLKPVAEVYRGVLPQFVRTGVHNFFSNINDVIVALNNLLQGKFLNAVSDVGRIAVNTTAGLFGVLDVATELGLEKHNEDFGQTLGYWGIGDGPYLVLPILGPSNLRDTLGLIVDFKTDPITYVQRSSDRNILWGLRMINRRAELLETSKILETAALDPYEFLRDAYLQRRRSLVYDGSPPPDRDEDVDIKIKPRGELPDSGPFPVSGERTVEVRSILVSGDAPTPAQLEAWEKAQRASNSSQPAAGAERSDAPIGQPHVVRFWSPASSSR
jgi:phospholipid-binding lipoprotein MlaA